MTESTIDQTHALLLHVADFLKKLPTDQIDDLLVGQAKLALLPKGARVSAGAGSGSQRAPKTAVDSAQVATDLARIGDRAAATQYLNDLKLTVAQVKQLAHDLDIPVGSKGRKDDYIATMVGLLVGRRLEHDALIRNSSAR